MAKTTLTQRVLQYMQECGSITSLDAFRELGVTRLAAIILNLKKAGVPIKTETMYSTNRWGDEVHFAKYSIITEEEDVGTLFGYIGE